MTPPSSQNIKEPENKKKYRVIAGLVATATIVGVLLLTVFLNPDSFREPIAAGISRATGLQVAIDSIGWSFKRGFELRCGGVEVRSANGKKKLFSMEKLFLELDLLPLLHKQIIIRSSTLVKPVIPIHANRLLKPAPAPSPEKPQSDTHSDTTMTHKSTSRQTPLELFKTSLKNADLTLSDIHIEKGQILLLNDNTPPTEENTLNVALALKVLRPSQDHVDVALNSIDLGIGQLKVTGSMEIIDALAQNASVQVNLKSNSFNASDLYSLELLPGEMRQFIEQKKLAGKFESVSLQMSSPLAAATDLESLKRHAIAQVAALVEDGSVTWDKTTIQFPRAEIDGDWENKRITVRGNALDGEFQITANMPPDCKAPGATSDDQGRVKHGNLPLGVCLANAPNTLDITLTDIHPAKLKLADDGLDGIVSGKLRMTESSSPDKDTLWQGNLKAKDLTLGAPEKHQTVENATVAVMTQNKDETAFDVKLNHISIGQTSLKQAMGIITVSDGKIRLTQGKIFPGHGQVDLNGSFYPPTQAYNVKFTGKKMAAEDWWPESVQGPLDLEGNLDQTKQGSLRNLSGWVQVRLSDGSLKQLGLVTSLLTLLNPQSILTAQKEGLPYSYLGGNFKINKGFVTTADLELDGPQLKVLAAGKADLHTENMKGEIKAMPLQLVDTVVKLIPVLGKILAGKKGGVVETYFDVSGTLSNPKFSLLPGKSLLGKPVHVLEELIKLPESLATKPKVEKPKDEEPSITEKEVGPSN